MYSISWNGWLKLHQRKEINGPLKTLNAILQNWNWFCFILLWNGSMLPFAPFCVCFYWWLFVICLMFLVYSLCTSVFSSITFLLLIKKKKKFKPFRVYSNLNCFAPIIENVGPGIVNILNINGLANVFCSKLGPNISNYELLLSTLSTLHEMALGSLCRARPFRLLHTQPNPPKKKPKP